MPLDLQPVLDLKPVGGGLDLRPVAGGVDANTDPFFQTTPSDPYAGAAEEMVRPVTDKLPAVTDDAAEALALMKYAEDTQPGRWQKQPQTVGEWTRFMLGGAFSPIKQTESAVESALIAVGAAKPGSRLLYRPSEALERHYGDRVLDRVPPMKSLPGQVAGGVANAAIGLVDFLMTPEGTLSLGIGQVPKTLQKIILTIFAGKMATEAPEAFRKAYEAAMAGDVQGAVEHVTSGTGAVAFSALLTKHGAFPEAPKPSGLNAESFKEPQERSMPVESVRESTIPKTDQALESVTEAKGTEKSPPSPTPTAVVSESGTVPVSAGNIPPARATLPLEEAQGRPTQPLSTEGAIKQAEPEQAVYPVRYSRETGGMVDALERSVDAEHKVIGKPRPTAKPELPPVEKGAEAETFEHQVKSDSTSALEDRVEQLKFHLDQLKYGLRAEGVTRDMEARWKTDWERQLKFVEAELSRRAGEKAKPAEPVLFGGGTSLGKTLRQKLPEEVKPAFDALPNEIQDNHGIARTSRVSGLVASEDAGYRYDQRRDALLIDRDMALDGEALQNETIASWAFNHAKTEQPLYESWRKAAFPKGELNKEGFSGIDQADSFARSVMRWMKGEASPEITKVLNDRFSAKAAQPEVVGMGGATPAEFKAPEPLRTAIKNVETDKNRVERGLNPILGPERQGNPEVWDRVMQKIDADPTWQDRLIEETKKTPRALTPDETLALDHRYVDLQNEYGKAVRDGEQHMKDGYELGVEQAKERAAFYEEKLNEVEQVAKTVGTESGRSLAMRRQLIKEDFSLASMESRMRAAKGFKPLTPEEHAQIKGLREKLDAAEKALAEAESKGVEKVTRRAQADVNIVREEFNRSVQVAREKVIWDDMTVFQKTTRTAANVYDAGRLILTTGEFSFVLRQGKMNMASHPIRTTMAIPSAIRAMRSKEASRRIEHEVLSHPDAAQAKRDGLALMDEGSPLARQEEIIMGRWGDAIPVVSAFNRAARVFLNKIRFDTWRAMRRSRGNVSPEAGKALAAYVNESTGRGSLGAAEGSAVLLGRAFFAPRWVVSRIQYAIGHSLWKKSDARTRAVIAGEYARTLVGMGVVQHRHFELAQFVKGGC